MHVVLLTDLVSKDQPFAFIVDSSTTKRNVPYFLCYIQTLEDGYPVSYYYRIIELKDGESADNTFNSFWKMVEADDEKVSGFKKYVTNKLVFLSSDSASTMVGASNSFYTRLQEKTTNRIKSVGCHAHKLSLVIKAAIKEKGDVELVYIQEFENDLNSLFRFYMSRGSKRLHHLARTAEMYGMHIVRLRKNIAVRWATAEFNVISAILTDWDALEEDLKLIP